MPDIFRTRLSRTEPARKTLALKSVDDEFDPGANGPAFEVGGGTFTIHHQLFRLQKDNQLVT